MSSWFSGQSYIEGSEMRVACVAEMAKRLNPELLIEVDGGNKRAKNCGVSVCSGS